MGASKDLATPAFDSAGARQRYESAYAKLKGVMSSLTPTALAQAFIELEAELDAGMIEVKTAMLTSGLFSSDDEVTLGLWIYVQHAKLAQIGARATQLCLQAQGFDTSRAMRLLALTFLHSGEAVKWELMVGRTGRREYRLGNSLMQMAIEKGRQHESGELIVDGMRRWSSIEQLFLRVHILDRFTSGNLTRQQIEVLDAWLWEWAPAMVGTSRYPGGVVLRADLDCDHGLRYGRRNSANPALYLPLAPLEERRKAIIKELHRGRVVPSRGRAANIRVEAHVAVLLQLRTLFAGGGSEGLPRATRHASAATTVEVVLGLTEILREVAGGPAPRVPEALPAQPASAGATRHVDYGAVYDKPRRMMTMRNASSSGYLLEVAERDAARIAVGDLVGLRAAADQQVTLGRVVRRVNEVARGVQVGVQLLSDSAWPIKVASLAPAAGKADEFLFVPGADPSGRFDSFVLPYGTLAEDVRYRVSAGGQNYTLAFNRVHRRGRGWAMAGFEIMDHAAPAGRSA